MFSSCAIFDGYKDNLHSWYASSLTQQDKRLIDSGDTLIRVIDTEKTKGTLLIIKGQKGLGKYNFVEIGEWEERFNYSGRKGEAITETIYDNYGNIISRAEWDKRKNDTDFYLRATYDSEISQTYTDSILKQTIIVYNPEGTKIFETNFIINDYKNLLSDRLKIKFKIDKKSYYNSSGELIKEREFRYEDKIKK